MMSIFKSDWDRIGGRSVVFDYVLGNRRVGGGRTVDASCIKLQMLKHHWHSQTLKFQSST